MKDADLVHFAATVRTGDERLSLQMVILQFLEVFLFHLTANIKTAIMIENGFNFILKMVMFHFKTLTLGAGRDRRPMRSFRQERH